MKGGVCAVACLKGPLMGVPPASVSLTEERRRQRKINPRLSFERKPRVDWRAHCGSAAFQQDNSRAIRNGHVLPLSLGAFGGRGGVARWGWCLRGSGVAYRGWTVMLTMLLESRVSKLDSETFAVLV
jgi:hypothetical protein